MLILATPCGLTSQSYHRVCAAHSHPEGLQLAVRAVKIATWREVMCLKLRGNHVATFVFVGANISYPSLSFTIDSLAW